MIKVLRLILLPFFFLWAPAAQAEQVTTADLHIFWSKGCPHCEHALAFLAPLERTTPGLRVIRYEVGSRHPENLRLLTELAQKHGIEQPGVPFIVLGDEVFVGYQDDTTTGQMLKTRIQACLLAGCATHLNATAPTPAPIAADRLPTSVELPLFGKVDLRQLSFPVLTIVLAAADGFNPCAMWVLVFLVGLSLGIKNRLRRWLLGGTFIAASALVYYLIMAAWLNTLFLLGAIFWLRTGIALLALVMGGLSLRDFFRNDPTCKVTAAPARRAILDKLKQLALSASLPLALIGITLLAFAVNIVELLCSAGIPAVYTQYLALSRLSAWQHYGYLGLYVLVFMANELIIYFLAMLTLEIKDIGQRFTRWSKLAGGIVLLVLGALMLLKPEWIM
ncbi:MAG: hypothetical protein BWY57_03090 [Betaproteobacteria bacterium ADurb.Bin341]|nr:MAG: hypothetical protein BWY57_03090 [Betaproteobacteria bacterium ADurb.Bin341]